MIEESKPSLTRRGTLAVAGAWLLVSLPAFAVWPALDGWSGSRGGPFSWDLLRPTLFWRPLEQLNLAVVSACPALFPWYLHLWAAAGHGLSAAAVQALARRAGASSAAATWAAIVFLVSPAVGASAWNIVGITQTWSTALGLASIVAYLRFAEGAARAAWLALAFLSTFWKESGLPFFLAAPLFGVFARSEIRETRRRRDLLAGIACLAVYLFLRSGLGPPSTFGLDEGRYALSLDPVRWATNAAMLLGAALTTVDTVALLGFPRQPAWGVVSVLAGLPLVGLAATRALRQWSLGRWLVAAGLVTLVLSVYLAMGHVSEKYAHPLVALLAVLLAAAFEGSRQPPSRALPAALATFLLASIAVDAHKLVEMIRTGRGSAEVGARIAAQTLGTRPLRVCVVAPDEAAAHYYSVFQSEPGPASQWGASVLPLWGWSHPRTILGVARREECPPWCDALWTVWVDGRVRVEALQPSAPAPAGR